MLLVKMVFSNDIFKKLLKMFKFYFKNIKYNILECVLVVISKYRTIIFKIMKILDSYFLISDFLLW